MLAGIIGGEPERERERFVPYPVKIKLSRCVIQNHHEWLAFPFGRRTLNFVKLHIRSECSCWHGIEHAPHGTEIIKTENETRKTNIQTPLKGAGGSDRGD